MLRTGDFDVEEGIHAKSEKEERSQGHLIFKYNVNS